MPRSNPFSDFPPHRQARRRQVLPLQPHMAPAGEGGGGEGQAFPYSQAVVGIAEQGQREEEQADNIGVPRGSGNYAGLAGAPDSTNEDAKHETHYGGAEQAVAH